MFKLIFVAVITTIFLGCSGSSSSSTQDSSPYLSAPRAAASSSLVPITQSITLEFSEVMDPSSFGEDTLFIKDSNDNIYPSVASADGDYMVILSPSAYFKKNSTYSVTVGVGIRDTDGRTLSKPYTFSFTTQNSGGSIVSPVVELVKPLKSVLHYDDLPVHGDVDISTRIAVQFDKEIDASNKPVLILELPDTQATVAGTTEVKGSVLVFTPDINVPLLEDTNYEIKIEDASLIKDLYGNSYSGELKWFFKTKQTESAYLYDSYNLNDGLGHKELISAITLKGTPIAVTASTNFDSTKIFVNVATDKGVEIYETDISAKTLSYKETLTFSSEIKSIKSKADMIIIGTAKDGIYFYNYDETSLGYLEHYDDGGNMGAVYGIDTTYDGESSYKVVAVSPTTGIYTFTGNSNFKPSFEKKIVRSGSAFIDVGLFEYEGNAFIIAADYNGAVLSYRFSGTELEFINTLGSPRYIAELSDIEGEPDPFMSTTLGEIESDNNISSAGFSNGFFGYRESFGSQRGMLYSIDSDKGIEFIEIGGSSHRSRITLPNADEVVDAFVFKDMAFNYSYLVALGSSNSMYIFNAVPDIEAPYKSVSTPYHNDDTRHTAIPVTITFNEILDLNSLNQSDFSYTDENGDPVPFAITSNISGSNTFVTLTPNSGGSEGCAGDGPSIGGCDVIIKNSVKDIVGNIITETTIHFYLDA